MNSAQRRKQSRKYRYTVDVLNFGYEKSIKVEEWCNSNFGKDCWIKLTRWGNKVSYGFSSESSRNWFAIRWM